MAANTYEDTLGQTNQTVATLQISYGGVSTNYPDYFAALVGSEIVYGTSGDDNITFGSFTAYDAGYLEIYTLGGSDNVSFEAYAAHENGGQIIIDLGEGDNTLTTNSNSAYLGGSIAVTSGGGNDTFNIGGFNGLFGGTINILAGNGHNTFIVGSNSFGNQQYYTAPASLLEGGNGIDIFNLGHFTAENGELIIDLGNEQVSDIVTITGQVGSKSGSLTILNYELSVDAKIDVNTPSTWVASIANTDLIFTQGQQTIIFDGLASGSIDPLDYFI